ncbi:predicted protein [Coccidioides posadasii str. Silveira]|uniref:Predicted protein n=1 Tax=Coccidioides posadasii (strain RMSCC 757 / Silveira) TaxID=443226 RepID=E9DF06_COCPS|nr:predicted protein [Coccidioides posadasii str. Silveira]
MMSKRCDDFSANIPMISLHHGRRPRSEWDGPRFATAALLHFTPGDRHVTEMSDIPGAEAYRRTTDETSRTATPKAQPHSPPAACSTRISKKGGGGERAVWRRSTPIAEQTGVELGRIRDNHGSMLHRASHGGAGSGRLWGNAR